MPLHRRDDPPYHMSMSMASTASRLALALLLLAAVGCDGLIVETMVRAPNFNHQPKPTEAPVSDRLKRLGVTEQLAIEVGPPAAKLRCWVVEPQGETVKGTVLVIHGWRNEMYWMLAHAQDLAKADYRAVLVDLRGHGGSTGKYITYGARESADLVQVINALDKRSMIDGKLGVWGMSMGASIAIQLAGLDPRVEAVVAVAPYTNMRQIVPHFVRTFLPLSSIDKQRIETLIARGAREAGFNPDRASALRAIQQTDAPVLIVHGSKDWMVPAEHGEALHKADPEQSKLLVIDGDGHVGVYFDADGQVRDAGLDWLDRHLTEQRRPTTPFP